MILAINQVGGYLNKTLHELKVARKKISADIEAEVMFKSNLLCCVDQKRGDQIHHIDGNNSNSNFDNLALLCFDCHHEASIKGNLRKKLSPKTILKFREHHYKVIQNQRDAFLKKLSHPIQKLTTEDLLNAAMEAIMLLEIEKLKIEYFNIRKSERGSVLDKFDAYENHISSRIAYEVLTFLVRVTYGTRDDMHPHTAQQIYFLATTFLRVSNTKSTTTQKNQLGIEALRISYNMLYDSIIHLRNLEIAQWALLLTKNVYWFSKDQKLSALIEKVHENYKEFERNLIRPERNDLDNAKTLVQAYKEDLNVQSLTFAPLPQHLYEAIQNSK